MPTDPERMEASLIAVADSGVDIRLPLFARFFAAFPERRPTFYSPDTASRRMTDETVQMMFGLASNESWVWPLVTELVFTHRNYGPLPITEYDAFIDMTVDELAAAAGERWDQSTDAAWRVQAEALKIMIRDARDQWTRVMPGQVSAVV